MSAATRDTSTKTTQTKQTASAQKATPALTRVTPHPDVLKHAAATPAAAVPGDLLSLQRAIGNRAVGQAIQRANVGAQGGDVDAGTQSTIQGARGGGQALDKGVSAQMGSAFGASFDHVKVHTDAQADSLNRSMSAKAFTLGSDIFFSKGNYKPGSSGGKQLLAHELTHVVQQGGTKPNKVQNKLVVGAAGDKYEQEADRIASQVMRSLSAPAARPDETRRVRRQVAPLRISRLSVQHTGVQRIQRNVVGDFFGAVFSRKQKYKSQSAKPERTEEYRKEADDFEKRLGYYIYNHPKAKSSAKAAITRMKEALIGDAKEDNPMYKKAIAGAFGRRDKQSAGQVGQEFDSVMAVLTGGNLRELMTAFYNTSLESFKKVVSQIMQSGNWDQADEMGLDTGALKARKKQQGVGDRDLYRPVGHPLKTSSSEFFWTNVGQAIKAKRWTGRHYRGKTSERTAGELEQGFESGGTNYGAELSDREKNLQYGKGHGDLKDEKLKWMEGGSFWKVNEASKWFKDIRGKLGMPVTAGPSGTTDRLMDVFKYLKVTVPVEDFRLALLGWMMTSNDHSFHEIMTIAKAKDSSLAYTPGPLAYRYISPLTLTELRNNVAKDKQFPDEIVYTQKLKKGDYTMMGSRTVGYAEQTLKKDPEKEKTESSKQTLEHMKGAGIAGMTSVEGYTGSNYMIQNPAAEGGTGLMSRLKVWWQLGHSSELSSSGSAQAHGRGEVSIKDLLKEAKVHNRFLQQTLLEMPDYQGSVYRGETAKKADWYKKGKAVTFQKFTSTTKNEAVAKRFADKGKNPVKVLWQIRSTNGKLIAPLSKLPNEGEVLLTPGSVVTISEAPVEVDGYLRVKATQTGGVQSRSGKQIDE